MKEQNECVIINKKSVFLDKKTKLGKNVIIYENCRIDGECVIDDNVTIFPGCFISNSIIGKGSKIYSSFIENSVIGKCTIINPYCHIKKSNLGEFVKVGDFCLIKQAKIEDKRVISTMSHINSSLNDN